MYTFGLGTYYLILCMFYEARGEDLSGKIAVGHVILNRARERGLTVEQVVKEPHQFSWYDPSKSHVIPQSGDREMEDCIRAAFMLGVEVMDGKNLDGANHYYNPHKVSPSWADDMTEVAVIGNHRFLRG